MSNTVIETSDNPSCAVDQSCCGEAQKAVVDDTLCTLQPAQIPERAVRWKNLFAKALSRDFALKSATFYFDDTPQLRRELDELVKLEQICCAHISWKLDRSDDCQSLTVTCEENVLQSILGWFENKPVDAINKEIVL